MTENRWLLYGANGYTGRLIAERAVAVGQRPILAGRNAEAISALAEKLALEHRVFELGDRAALAAALRGVDAVLLAAGPFSQTSAPVVRACLATKTHYLDITGEISVFERCRRDGERASDAGIVLLPGVGFDVVPSDCLAKALSEALPNAERLELGIYARGRPSKGTLRTFVAGLGQGAAVREAGQIRRVPLGARTLSLPLAGGERTGIAIGWGDVSTAHASTGIPNITVYMTFPPKLVRWLKLAGRVRPLFALPGVTELVERLAVARARGEGTDLEQGRAELWGRVTDGTGRSQEGFATTPDGYRLTANSAVESLRCVLENPPVAGFQTPSLAFGSGFLSELEGCRLDLGPPRTE